MGWGYIYFNHIVDVNLIFKQDRWPFHYDNILCDFLDEKFSKLWIGRDEWKVWAPHLSNLTLIGSYIWGMLNKMWTVKGFRTFNSWATNLRSSGIKITPNVLLWEWEKLNYRLEICRTSHVTFQNDKNQHIMIPWQFRCN